MNAEDEKDLYENSYHSFVQALEVLAAAPEIACERLGHFNVSYETKRDAEAGPYLFNYACCPLNSLQRSAIVELVGALNTIPEKVLEFTKVPQQSLEHMHHPIWVPIREQSKRLLSLLQSVTEANERYLWPNGK